MDLKDISFSEFYNVANMTIQTAVVEELIKLTSDSEDALSLRILNDSTVALPTPVGKIDLPSEVYFNILNEHSRVVSNLNSQKADLEKENRDTGEIDKQLLTINSFAGIFQDKKITGKKIIAEWRLISGWLAKEFIDRGEVILQAYGNTWWGIPEPIFKKEYARDFLETVFNEMKTR